MLLHDPLHKMQLTRSKFVTGFAKRGLLHTSSLSNLMIHNFRLQNSHYHEIWTVVSTNINEKKFRSVSALKPKFMELDAGSWNWMCVEDPFLQIQSHLCIPQHILSSLALL